VPAKEIVAALARLRDTGTITATTTRTGGRPAETWAAVVPAAAEEAEKEVSSPDAPLITSSSDYHAPAAGLERRVL
jgi:hypothetical protein